MSIRKILVIDDEQIVLDSIKKILKGTEFSVDPCLNSKDGLAKAIDGDYDLVLSDIRMPDIGGMKILREIRRKKPTLPVVMVTGYATVESAVQAMKLGAEDFLEKPFTPDRMLETVRKAVSKDHTLTPEKVELIHKEELITILERAAKDGNFVAELFYRGADALESYHLTPHEKLALLTGDIQWIESYVGPLNPERRKWLESRLSAEIW